MPPRMITRKVRLGKAKRSQLAQTLASRIGAQKVSTNPAVLFGYAGASPLFGKEVPAAVVRPACVEDVQRVLEIARAMRIPVTPIASGTQEPGNHPLFGGIVLDTMSMDRILEIDPERGYAVIEPGVTIGSLAEALLPHGLRCTVGSFPTTISALSNYCMTAVNTHRSSGIPDDVLGLEVVLADGSVLTTGSRAFKDAYPGMTWHLASNTFPNLKNLFLDANGTLGVITKGAVRIYEKCEAQAMLVAGFETYEAALSFMRRISCTNLVQHVCAWHWALYSIIDHLGQYGRGSPADVMIYDPWTKPDSRPYVLVVPSMAGYREDMEAHESVCRRLIADLGGVDFTEECRAKWPGAWKFFTDHYRDHMPTNQFMGGFGEAFPLMPMVIGDPCCITGLEEWGLKFLRASPLKMGLTYYSHIVDQGRAVFLRMTPFVSPFARPEEIEEAKRTRARYLEEAHKRYNAIPVRFDFGHADGEVAAKTGVYGQVLRAIKRTLDPVNILNPAMSLQMYGKGEGE